MSNLFVKVDISDDLLRLPLSGFVIKDINVKQVVIKVDNKELEVRLKIRERLSRKEINKIKDDLMVLLDKNKKISVVTT